MILIPITPLTTPNGIQIQSAVLPQYTLRTDPPTDSLYEPWLRDAANNSDDVNEINEMKKMK